LKVRRRAPNQVKNMTEIKNPTVNDIGGASSSSVSQLRPIRSYEVEGCGGTIYLYVFTTQLGEKVAVLTYHDPYYANEYEDVYAAALIIGSSTGWSLLRDASDLYEKLHPDSPNPFMVFEEQYEKEMELINTIGAISCEDSTSLSGKV
jgi:hypothetical protein